ncbi:MAG: hypothetical protein J6S14_15775 [Clostridia bacterium]|nr:hypothetical protein [Clostridia bacterium]
MPFDQKTYNKEYDKQTYSRIQATILKEDLDTVKALADEYQMSISDLILNALNRTYGLNLKKKRK